MASPMVLTLSLNRAIVYTPKFPNSYTPKLPNFTNLSTNQNKGVPFF